MNLATLLHAIHHHYHFHVYHTIQTSVGFSCETNCGPKKISVWDNEKHVKWSFLWRESLVQKGTRQVDRFIRTRDGSPYLRYKQKYIVVQDEFDLPSFPLDTAQQWYILGAFTGKLYQSFRESTEYVISAANEVVDVDQYKKDQHHALQTISKKVVLASETTFAKLVKFHWKQIEQRWRQSLHLYRPIAFYCVPSLRSKQFVLQSGSWLGFYTNSKNIQAGFHSLASFIQNLMERDQDSLEGVKRFYSAFESVYEPTLQERYQLLSCLLYPELFIKLIEKYEEGKNYEQSYYQKWMRYCDLQERYDQFYQWLVNKIDHFRKDAVSQ